MSAETQVAPRSESTYKQRVTTFLDSRRGKMFGFAEVAALAGSCFVLLLVLLSYLYFFVPARSRVNTANDEKARLQANLKTLEGVVKQGHDTKTQVDEIATSLAGFEKTYLPRPDEGRMGLYDELNQLIVKNNLRNTSGPTYAPLDPTGTKAVSGKTTTTKWQSFYPGIAVLVTVEGQYADIRHFVRDLERSKEFVIINEVELQRANENNSTPAVSDETTASSPKGSLISLQMNLTTYFQRENSANNSGQGQ
jgi:Tfp pilus assembly protein PilO